VSVNSRSGNARPLVGHAWWASGACFRAPYERVLQDYTTRSEGLLLKQDESDEPGRRRQSMCQRLDDVTLWPWSDNQTDAFLLLHTAPLCIHPTANSVDKAYNYSVRSWQKLGIIWERFRARDHLSSWECVSYACPHL